jgi:hypothetical protein
MVVVLYPTRGEEPALQPESLERLASLGITSVAIVRDETTVGFVLEGWAFDPARAWEAVLAVVGARDGVRTLEPLAQMAVLTPRERSTR